ncbi:MAG: hypothetical protein LBQ68_09930 [Clostridiales bacterium]|jgi:hypothetical protein|nr:hypothetical protein [Clostridiales bacterium]
MLPKVRDGDMKRIAAIILVILFVLVAQIAVCGATKQDILDELTADQSINGGIIKIPESVAASLRDFLNTDTYTQAELDFIYDAAITARDMWKATRKTSLGALTKAEQDMFINMAVIAAKKLGATLSVSNSENGLTIYLVSRTGRVFNIAWFGGTATYESYNDNDTGNFDISNPSPDSEPTVYNNPIKATGLMLDFRLLFGLLYGIFVALIGVTKIIDTIENRRFFRKRKYYV